MITPVFGRDHHCPLVVIMHKWSLAALGPVTYGMIGGMHEVRRLPGPGPLGDEIQPHRRDDGTLVDGLLDGLLSDVVPQPPGPLDAVARALEAHREHARAWYGDLVGPLSVPAAAVGQLVDALRSSDHAMRVVLMSPWNGPAEGRMQAGRAQLLDDDRVELAGVELSLAPAPTPASAAVRTLADLDVSAPAWLRIPAAPSWIEALDEIENASYGLTLCAERVALVLPAAADGAAHQGVAAMIQSLASRKLSFCIVGQPGEAPIDLVTSGSAYGLLNLLCAVARAAEGAGASDGAVIGDIAARLSQLTTLLGDTDSEAVIDEARRIGPAAAAATRALFDRVSCGSVRALVGDLEAAGLIVPDVA